MGLHISLKLLRWGFYPRGGGEVLVEAQPSSHLKSLVMEKRGPLLGIKGFSAIANLPQVIAERQRGQALSRLSAEGLGAQIEIVTAASPGPGTCLFLLAEFEHARAGFSALGERGKPAEKVADEAVEALFAFLRSEAAVDPFLADQLLLPMALAEGASHMTTSRLSQHLFTNAWVIKQLLPIRIDVEGEVGGPGRVTVEGVGFH
jgi:RNA 3'-terminal phosphate cyclase (ATP)